MNMILRSSLFEAPYTIAIQGIIEVLYGPSVCYKKHTYSRSQNFGDVRAWEIGLSLVLGEAGHLARAKEIFK